MVERIRTLLDSRQLTPTQFADQIGVARPIISHVLSGRNKPSLEVVQRILAAMPDLSMAWLLNGTGPMLAPVNETTFKAVPVVSAATAIAPSVEAVSEPKTRSAVPSQSLLTSQVANQQEDDKHSDKQPPVGASPTAPAAPGPRFVAPSAQPFRPSSKATAVLPRRFAAKALTADENVAQAAGSAPELLYPSATPPATQEVSPLPQALPEAPTVPSAAQVVAPDAAVAPAMVASLAPGISAAEPRTSGNPAPQAAPSLGSDVASALFSGAEKPIRRIVIFYRDGSFADYQPE